MGDESFDSHAIWVIYQARLVKSKIGEEAKASSPA